MAGRSARLSKIPWYETAVIMRQLNAAHGGHELVRAGSLWELVEWVSGHRGSLLDLLICLPDRGVQPFSFSPSETAKLLKDPTRPGASALLSPLPNLIGQQALRSA